MRLINEKPLSTHGVEKRKAKQRAEQSIVMTHNRVVSRNGYPEDIQLTAEQIQELEARYSHLIILPNGTRRLRKIPV